MMLLKIFTILDKIGLKYYNKPNIPFGGLQLIFSGDFYQLQMIKSNDSEKEFLCFVKNTHYGKNISIK